MDKNTKIGIIVIVAIVVLVGAYFLGKSSNNSNQPITTSSDNSLQTTPTSQEPTQNQNNTISEANNLNIASENGLACKNTAEAAASSDSINKSVTVIRTKYNQITNVCYYEVLINDGSDTEMDIRVARMITGLHIVLIHQREQYVTTELIAIKVWILSNNLINLRIIILIINNETYY